LADTPPAPADQPASILALQYASHGTEVVIAIIGGTLLALALTRPKLDWVEKLEDSSRSTAQVLITIVAFAMGGYAYGSLYIVLHRQLGGDIDKLLRGAGAFFLIYALSVHFEPFSGGHGWTERASLIVLYVAVAIAAILGGVVFVEYTLSHSVSGWPTLIEATFFLLAATVIYLLVRKNNRRRADPANAEGEAPRAVPATHETA
jgi:hypothetical protein